MEPSGSAPTIRISGFCSFRYLSDAGDRAARTYPDDHVLRLARLFAAQISGPVVM